MQFLYKNIRWHKLKWSHHYSDWQIRLGWKNKLMTAFKLNQLTGPSFFSIFSTHSGGKCWNAALSQQQTRLQGRRKVPKVSIRWSEVWGLNEVRPWKRLRPRLLFVCICWTNASGSTKTAGSCNTPAHVAEWLRWHIPSGGWSSSCGWSAPGWSRGGSELDGRWAGGLRWATDARSPQTQSLTWGYLKKEEQGEAVELE